MDETYTYDLTELDLDVVLTDLVDDMTWEMTVVAETPAEQKDIRAGIRMIKRVLSHLVK